MGAMGHGPSHPFFLARLDLQADKSRRASEDKLDEDMLGSIALPHRHSLAWSAWRSATT